MVKDYKVYKKIGKIKKEFLESLELDFNGEVYIDESVLKHIIKRHGKQLTRNVKGNINIMIERIIKSPDYIGKSEEYGVISLKLVKKIDAQVMLVLDYDYEKGYMYVATMYPIYRKRLKNKILSGGLKKISR